MEPPALINRQIFLNVGHWVPPTPTSLRIDFCDCVVPLRANLFIFHGLLNRFPSVRGFPVELIYFIPKPHGEKKFRILFDTHLTALPFPFSVDAEPTSAG